MRTLQVLMRPGRALLALAALACLAAPAVAVPDDADSALERRCEWAVFSHAHPPGEFAVAGIEAARPDEATIACVVTGHQFQRRAGAPKVPLRYQVTITREGPSERLAFSVARAGHAPCLMAKRVMAGDVRTTSGYDPQSCSHVRG